MVGCTGRSSRVPDSLLFDKVLIVGMDIGGRPFVVTSKTRKEGDYYEAIGKAQCIRQSVSPWPTPPSDASQHLHKFEPGQKCQVWIVTV
jgi:hypothetical protein